MNREIKFRAWDIDKKIMTYHPMLNMDYCIDNHNEKIDDSHIILLQFTGKVDLNGKEIFEGDIVKTIVYDYTSIATKEIVKISSIEYRVKGFWVKDEDFGWEGEDLWDWGKIEVIGNIYENPELLENEG